jgi:hypothetical protein
MDQRGSPGDATQGATVIGQQAHDGGVILGHDGAPSLRGPEERLLPVDRHRGDDARFGSLGVIPGQRGRPDEAV